MVSPVDQIRAIVEETGLSLSEIRLWLRAQHRRPEEQFDPNVADIIGGISHDAHRGRVEPWWRKDIETEKDTGI